MASVQAALLTLSVHFVSCQCVLRDRYSHPPVIAFVTLEESHSFMIRSS
jgi:hypothetical protein